MFYWYVLNYDFNRKTVRHFNVFCNVSLYESTVREVKKYLRAPSKYEYKTYDGAHYKGFEAFVKQLDSLIKWQEWGRCEYELGVTNKFCRDLSTIDGTDCYEQCKPNMELIAHTVIRQYKEYKKNGAKDFPTWLDRR